MPQMIPKITKDLALEWAAACMKGEEAEEAWLAENIENGRIEMVQMPSAGDPRILWLDDAEVRPCGPSVN